MTKSDSWRVRRARSCICRAMISSGGFSSRPATSIRRTIPRSRATSAERASRVVPAVEETTARGAAGQFAGEELARGRKLVLIVGSDGGGDAFGGGEVEAAVEEGTGGEFAWFGSSRAEAKQFFEQHAGEERIAGDVEFKEVLAGVA